MYKLFPKDDATLMNVASTIVKVKTITQAVVCSCKVSKFCHMAADGTQQQNSGRMLCFTADASFESEPGEQAEWCDQCQIELKTCGHSKY